MYRICWQSKITGLVSHGEYLYTYEQAESICKQSNKDWPMLEHWPERKLNDNTDD